MTPLPKAGCSAASRSQPAGPAEPHFDLHRKRRSPDPDHGSEDDDRPDPRPSASLHHRNSSASTASSTNSNRSSYNDASSELPAATPPTTWQRPAWMDPDPLAWSCHPRARHFEHRHASGPDEDEDVAAVDEDIFTPSAAASHGLHRDDPRLLRGILDALNCFDVYAAATAARLRARAARAKAG